MFFYFVDYWFLCPLRDKVKPLQLHIFILCTIIFTGSPPFCRMQGFKRTAAQIRGPSLRTDGLSLISDGDWRGCQSRIRGPQWHPTPPTGPLCFHGVGPGPWYMTVGICWGTQLQGCVRAACALGFWRCLKRYNNNRPLSRSYYVLGWEPRVVGARVARARAWLCPSVVLGSLVPDYCKEPLKTLPFRGCFWARWLRSGVSGQRRRAFLAEDVSARWICENKGVQQKISSRFGLL